MAPRFKNTQSSALEYCLRLLFNPLHFGIVLSAVNGQVRGCEEGVVIVGARLTKRKGNEEPERGIPKRCFPEGFEGRAGSVFGPLLLYLLGNVPSGQVPREGVTGCLQMACDRDARGIEKRDLRGRSRRGALSVRGKACPKRKDQTTSHDPALC